MAKPVMVFGSNTAGLHGAGAAKFAYQQKGARYGQGYGRYGESFAIPTKDERIQTLSLAEIADFVCGFLAYARHQRKDVFHVTRIGCGLAGYQDSQIAPLFVNASKNCLFDEAWRPWLGDTVSYWGTFDE
ncbi:hypothetical protein FROZEN_17 [Erwinia phage vB_EamP_Frozen]|uniref:Uncharacterized protein n=2 Tax=Johnsonvirus frozen TaxID=1982578 RepID=A0A191ZD70_9CAUD|nr:hypothetical protein FROZEN_17 [Erwinia phage vB_EamP_Frozen]ANJ65149.1 hypothetical protein FROZEN_17 [Erwinia phage vB_EamP_Frozen]ANJ65333.1 hypothetical protein GUTMEISTER_17 [Erwinia phage vB_EamP_Gutmeister]